MKKLLVLSLALILGVFVGFALKPVPTVTKATNTVTNVGKKSTTVTGKTNVGTTSKTMGTALPNKSGFVIGGEDDGEDPDGLIKPTTGVGKTTNTGTSKVVLPGNSKSVPSTTVGVGGVTIDKDGIKGGINPRAEDDNDVSGFISFSPKQPDPNTQPVTFTIAGSDDPPTTPPSTTNRLGKTAVTNPVLNSSKTGVKTTIKPTTLKTTQKATTKEVKTTQDVMKR